MQDGSWASSLRRVLYKTTVADGKEFFPEGTLKGNTFSYIIFPAVITGSTALLSPLLSNLHGRRPLHAILTKLPSLRVPLPRASTSVQGRSPHLTELCVQTSGDEKTSCSETTTT